MRLAGKTAIVTGASAGMGEAIAALFAREGANVVAVARRLDRLEQLAAAEKDAPGKILPCRGDIGEPATSRRMVDLAVTSFGRLDILVNNAGITRDALVLSMKEEDFEKVIDTNLNSAFYMIKNTYHQFMKRRSGRIINISSISGLMGNAGQANYAAAKAGMVGLTKSVAKELAGRGITCNAVAPGFIETDMTAVLSEKVKAAAEAQIPMKKMGKPEDVAAAVAFLASDAARYITGQVLSVDGGMGM